MATKSLEQSSIDKATVAVIGAGPTGLTVLKTLREDGFECTLYERRPHVGGLWAYSENPAYTTALAVTRANISKFTCGFADFPMPDKYPIWLSPAEFQEYMESYASHFDLFGDIVLSTAVRSVRRDPSDTKWLVDVETTDPATGEVKSSDTVTFDKVVFCHGYQTKARIPSWEGQETFTGTIMHAQAYRSAEPFRDKTVVAVGLGSTTGDVVPNLAKVARKVYVSHRRGAIPGRRVRNGAPAELAITWRRHQISHFLSRHFPALSRKLADVAVRYFVKSMFGELDPAWKLEPFPNITLSLPGVWDNVMPLLKDGTVTSLAGVKRFLGGRQVEFDDGTVLDDVDALVLCTGYSADWSIAPFVETSVPDTPGYGGAPIYRLYMNMVPPKYADSCALLAYSAYGKNNGFSFADVTAGAVSNVFRGVERLPSLAEMERHVDAHQRWVAAQWKLDPCIDTSMVKQWEFQGFLHRAAGTGMENAGWGWEGWKFWFRDRKMYNLINHGVETAHGFRYFETERRKAWKGAGEAIIHVNEVVRARFPDANLK